MDKNIEYQRYINLEKLDHFIQFSLGRFKYYPARNCLYKSAGQYSYDIVNNKSILPDLVIYNSPFDKNTCFYGSNTTYHNSFPRKRFQVQSRNDGNSGKSKSSNRRVTSMHETQEPNMFYENDYDDEEDPQWMDVDVQDVAKGIKFQTIPNKQNPKDKVKEKTRKVEMNDLDQEIQNLNINRNQPKQETYNYDILDELFQENLDSYGIKTSNKPNKKKSNEFSSAFQDFPNDFNQNFLNKNKNEVKNISQVPLNLNPMNVNPYMNFNPMMRIPPMMNNNIMNRNIPFMMNNMNKQPMGFNNFTRMPINQQMMMLNNMTMKPFNNIMNNQIDNNLKQPRFPGFNLNPRMPQHIPMPMDYHMNLPKSNIQDPRSIIHRNLNEKGWFIQIDGKNMLNLNTFELFNFLSDVFKRGGIESNNITIQDFKTDMFFNPKSLYENLIDTFSNGSIQKSSMENFPKEQPLNLNLNMNFMGNTYNNYMFNSRIPDDNLDFLNRLEDQDEIQLNESRNKTKKKSKKGELNLSADL